METIDAILLALIIIVICLIIYTWVSNRDEKKRKHARELIDASAGGYDKFANEAVREIEKIRPDRRTAEDNYRAGTLLEFNLLNGETENAPRGVLGNIMRNYVDAFERMAENAQQMREERTERIVRHIQAERRQPEIVMGGFGGGGGDMPLQTVIMVDHIEDFTDNDFGDLFDGEDGGIFGGLMNALVGHITQTAPIVREADREERRERTAAAAETRAEAITEYMAQTQTHTSDAQNVHDSKVNKDLRASLLAIEPSLRRDKTLPDVINEMTEFLFESDLNNDQRELVIKSLDIIAKDNYIGTLQCTEGHVFKTVWDRTEAPENAVNSKLMKEALATALVEFWENGADHDAVCINGRCGRMLASLVLLDYDDSAGAVQTKEMIKNEVIKDATDIINDSIDEACVSQIEVRRKVGQSYKDPKIECDDVEEEKFIEEMKQKINNMMEHKYRNRLNVRDFNNIRDDIYAGL